MKSFKGSILVKKTLEKLGSLSFFDTLKHTSFYFIGTILVQVLGIISLPVYTYYLEPSEFGIVEIFNSSVKILAVLLTLNTFTAISRYYLESKDDWKSFIGTSFMLSFFILIIFSSIVFLFRSSIVTWLNIPENIFIWLFPSIIGYILLSIFNQFFVVRKESVSVASAQVIMAYSRFAGALLLLAFWSSDYLGRIMGDAIATLLITFGLFYHLWKYIEWKFVWKHAVYIFLFAIPLIPYSLNGFILSFFDMFMINSSVSQTSAGLYGFAYKIGMIFLGFDLAVQNAAKVDYYAWMNKKEYHSIDTQVRSIVKIEMLAASFLILFAQDMGNLLASREDYNESLDIIPLIVLSYVFFGIYQLYGRMLYFSKKTILVSLITLCTAILNILLNLKFIPLYGYKVAALTTLVSFGLMSVLAGLIVKIFVDAPLPKASFIYPYLAVLLIALFPVYILDGYFDGILLFLVVKGIFFLLVALILYGKKLQDLIQDLKK